MIQSQEFSLFNHPAPSAPSMSNSRAELERAIASFDEFLMGLSRTSAANAPRGGFDLPITIEVEVERQAVLDCFLKLNPKFASFRAQMAEVNQDLSAANFILDPVRWDAAKQRVG
jgi:hypothetical protein